MLIHYPPQQSKDVEDTLVSVAIDWALCNGLTLKIGDDGSARHAPMTLYPTPFSKSGFEEALRVQTAYNQLYASIALNHKWLIGILKPLCRFDYFTASLVDIAERSDPCGRTQHLTGGIFRSDYMVNRLRTNLEGRQIKQVEFNTVGVSFACLSDKVHQLHHHLSRNNSYTPHGYVPQPESISKIAKGIALMHHAYAYSLHHNDPPEEADLCEGCAVALDSDSEEACTKESSASAEPQSPSGAPPHERQHGSFRHKFLHLSRRSSRVSISEASSAVSVEEKAHSTSSSSQVLFVVQPNEANVMDQRFLEYELLNEHDISCVRITLGDVLDKLSVNEHNRLTYLPTGREVSVVYYRSGYAPSDYPTDRHWEARAMLENSHAIQCPSVLTQLAGTKKVQQAITSMQEALVAAPGFDTAILERLSKTFVAIYPLDDSELGKQGRTLAFESPENYVLKPQREGGGNNIYRDEIPEFLQSIPEESWQAYVLMELIDCPKISNKIIKNGELISGRVINELGVYGTMIWDRRDGKTILNEQAGWLLRTKLQDSDEGGIAAGFGCLDSVLIGGLGK